uniref:Uncharacterized protein n=1 Tax=Trichogramma kaykai TaxID=54128 RepID=A0ABD2WGK9_9HYME
MKTSNGRKYSDFVKHNCKKAAELFLKRDWREMSEFFEETELFEEREDSSKTVIRLIKAYIFRSLRKRYLKMAADVFWRNNEDMRHIVQAVPEVRDKIEEHLDDNDFLAMYESALPKKNPNTEIEMFEIPQIFMGKTYDVMYRYCWYKTYPKIPQA